MTVKELNNNDVTKAIAQLREQRQYAKLRESHLALLNFTIDRKPSELQMERLNHFLCFLFGVSADFLKTEQLRVIISQNYLNAILASLKPRDSMFLVLKYGLLGAKPMSFQEIGNIFSISGTRVRQVHNKAMRLCRHPYRSALVKSILFPNED